MKKNWIQIFFLVLLCAITSCSRCSNTTDGFIDTTPVLVTDADEIYEQFKTSREPIAIARDSARVTIERYIRSKVGTNFNLLKINVLILCFDWFWGNRLKMMTF